MTSLSVAVPARNEVRPLTLFKENTVWIRGFRMSASIRRTFEPVCVNEIATFTAVVVLPSLGAALVTTIVRGGWPDDESNNDVRTERYASAISEEGASCTTRSTVRFLSGTF